MLQDNGAVPWQLSGSVIIRLDDADTEGIFHQVSFDISHIQPQAHKIVTRDKRKARDVTNKDLLTQTWTVGTIGLEQTMRREDALPKDVIEAQPNIEAVR